MILVKSPDHDGPARVHYADIGDYLSREEKLERLRTERSLRGTDYIELAPNEAGDWINQRDDRFWRFQPISGDGGIFATMSNGLKTNRDAWCFSFSRPRLESQMRRLIDNSNAVAMKTNTFDPEDPTQVNWNRALRRDAERGVTHDWDDKAIRLAAYRPFTREWVYFDRAMNDMIYRLPKLFPTTNHPNHAIVLPAGLSTAHFAPPLMHDLLPALTPNGGNQLYARHTWESITATDGGFNFAGLDASEEEVTVDGYRQVDNITDLTLQIYRRVYADDTITKDDIFYGVYGLLHHPEYRERYEADLKKMLPRIPHVASFREYALIGRELADLHVNYENAPPRYDLTEVWAIDPPEDEFERYAIEKMSWTKRSEHTAIKVNAHLTLTGIPEQANAYTIGGRSPPLEWILDRYRVKVDKASGIINDPNAWLREHDDPRYVVNLIASLVTLSLETQRLVAELPAFEVIE